MMPYSIIGKHRSWNTQNLEFCLTFFVKILNLDIITVFFTSIYKLRSYLNHPILVQTVKQYEIASINVVKTRLVTTKIIQTPDAKITNVQTVWKSWKQFLFWIRHRCTLHFPQVILPYSWHKLHLFLSLVGIGQCPKQS